MSDMTYEKAKEYLQLLPKPLVVTVDSQKYKAALCHGFIEGYESRMEETKDQSQGDEK